MRCVRGNPQGDRWVSATVIRDEEGNPWTYHLDTDLADFVPEETKVRGHDARHWSGEAIRLEQRLVEARGELNVLRGAADAAEERARLAERDARAERAEVERLRGVVTESAGRQIEVAKTVSRLSAQIDAIRAAIEREAAHGDAITRCNLVAERFRTVLDAQNPAQDSRTDVPAGDGGSEDATGAPEGVQTELATALMPHAVTEERLAEALSALYDDSGDQGGNASLYRGDARAMFALLRGESRG